MVKEYRHGIHPGILQVKISMIWTCYHFIQSFPNDYDVNCCQNYHSPGNLKVDRICDIPFYTVLFPAIIMEICRNHLSFPMV